MTKIGARTIDVGQEQSGRRLDNYLSGILEGVPKSFIYRIIRRGEVRVNGGRARPDRKLKADDKVRVPPMLETEGSTPIIGAEKTNLVSRSIIFENANMLVVNKPAGLAVHAGSGLRFGVIDIVRQLRPENPDIELVHRLDRDTSGCLILAKTYPDLRLLQTQMADPASRKTYLSLLDGVLGVEPIEVTKKLSTVQRGGEKHTVIAAEGKTAFTTFTQREVIAGYSLVKVGITTGRTHQIRVHAQSIGHPVVGDKKYGDESSLKNLRKAGLRRMFLHANTITLSPTQVGARISIEAPLPSDLEQFLLHLRCRNSAS